jgi:hypothetical protein
MSVGLPNGSQKHGPITFLPSEYFAARDTILKVISGLKSEAGKRAAGSALLFDPNSANISTQNSIL